MGGFEQTVLRLEYTCTAEEISEAKSLQLRHSLGGGSAAMTLIKLLGILVGVLALFYFELPPQHRKYLLASLPIVFAVAFFMMLRQRKKKAAQTVMQVSEEGIR